MNENQQNPYNQQPQGEQMPPFTPMPPQLPTPMRQRMMNGARRMQNLFPRWLSIYPIVTYIFALAVVSFMYSEYSLPWYYMLSGVVAVVAFFLLSSSLIPQTSYLKIHKSANFERRIFLIAFVPRFAFMLILYWIFQANFGDAYGFEAGDAQYYHSIGSDFADAFNEDRFKEIWNLYRENIDISDLGYGFYVSIIYLLTGKSVLAIRILKCIWSSLSVVLIYRITKRNFDGQTARIAAIICALWPNFWYYCAVHLKETEMVFLVVLFVEQADQMLRSRQFTAWKIVPILLIAAAMFTFRTPLGLVALLALVFSVVMSSSKVVSWRKKIVVGILAILLVGVIAGGELQERAKQLLESQKEQQESGINWYATRQNGNALAKYAGSAVFAPMIFTLPFPSMVQPFEGQDVQQLLNGGNFVKNIMSCFTIFAMIMLLMSGKWRENVLPLSFMLGYLVVLALSSFAHSERFHQAAMPFEFMFAAYGLSIAVTKMRYKRWFTYWCILMFIACIAWNWFKMAGRGLA